MKDFTFNLQRFADVCKVESTGKIYGSLSAAYAAAQDGDTITFLANRTENGITISKSITIDFGGYKYHIDNGTVTGSGNRAFTTSSSANVTFQNGSITTKNLATAINTAGSLTLFNLTTGRNVSSTGGDITINSTSGSSTGTTTINTGSGNYVLDNGVTLTTSANNTMTLTVNGDQTATAVLNKGQTLTASETSGHEVEYKAIGSAVTFTYDDSGTAHVTNLSVGNSFSVSIDNANAVTYTLSSGGIQAERDGVMKVSENIAVSTDKSFVIGDWDFDNENTFTKAILTDSTTANLLTISDSLSVGDRLKVIDYNDYSKSFGYLERPNSSTYTLTKESDNNKSLSSIVIEDGLTVQIASDYKNVPITVSNASTTLRTTSDGDFTMSSANLLSGSDNKAASVTGAVSVSLGSGTVKIAAADDTLKPTINAGSYAVSYASGSGDGVAVIANSKSTQVSGIDKGEAFIVGSSSYYRDAVGLRNAAGGVFTSDVASLSGGTDGYVSIELANLKDSIGEFVNPDSDNVLEIGKTNVNNAVIVNDTDNPTVKYAEVLAHKSASSGNLYTLRAADGIDFTDAVGTISLTGGAGTTIDKELVDGVKIVASSGSKPDATFKVTDVTGDTFTVNLKTTTAATKISTDATGITLISGTINAQAGQTITLGENGRKIAVSTSSSGMEVTVTATADGEGNIINTATIKGAANDVFSIDGNEYTIDKNSDGMTFTVTADNVIVSDLGTADKDAFTYDGATYSVRGAGFIMTKSGNHSIWSDVTDNGHSLDGGTVTIENLFADDHTWNLTASVSAADNSATLPPSDNSMKVTLIGDDFKQTYGTFTKSGTGVSLETGSSSNEAKLSQISVGSAVDNFDFGTDLTDISIIADVATFIVTEDDDDGKGYQVTLTSSASDEKIPAKVASAKRASLISGSLQSDSYFTATVLDNRIVSVGDAKVTLSTNGKESGTSINGLKVGESFSIEGGGKYVMSKVGLVDASSRYLPGTRSGNPINLASLNSDSAWGGLIDKDSITINSATGTALIVDFDESGEPVTLYADYTSSTQSFTKSNSADKWDDNIVINIDNTTVNFTSYFEDAKIAGVQSGAEFSVEDNVDFTVQDVRAGAVIGSATNISQTGGKVSLISGQVSHSDAGSLSADTGNLTFTVNDDKGTIAALDSGDVFTFKKDSSNVTYTRNALGLVTNDDRLFTAYMVGDSVTVSELLAGLQADDSVNGTWTNTIYISNNALAIPPTTNVTAPWIILNSSTSKSIRYGTLATVDGGYSVTKSALDSVWSSSATFSINADPVTFSRDFSGARISGVQSGAIVTVADATGEFTFNDDSAGATITGDGSNKINQTAGLVVPHDGQTIIGGSYSIVGGSEGSIAVNVSGANVLINELSTGDTFAINGYSFEVLDGGVILRDGTHLWQNGDTSATAANLIGSSNWYGFSEIEASQDLVINSALLANLSTGKSYIVDKDNHENIYGSINRSSSSGKYVYTISTDGANVDTFTSVTIAEEVESVTFVKEHFITNSIPITAGGATFIVTGTTSSNTFSVNYDYSTQTTSVGTATSLTLTDGTLTLSNKNQTVTANGQTIKVANGTITANVTTNDDKSTVVTVGSLDTANDSVILNGETYTYVSGNGMTITIADGVTKFTNLDDDSFTIGSYTYTKTTNGFVKTSSSGTDYMWVNDSVDVSQGVDVNLLKSTDAENWKPIAAITDGKITIDSSSTDTVVLVGDLTNPTETIYGTLTVDGSSRSLTKDGGANTTLTSITVDGVTVSISSDFGTVPIIPQNNATINTDGTLTFTPAVGTTFIVNDTTYTMTNSGSLTTGDKIWTSSDKKTYTLPNADAPWGVYNGTVTLDAGDSITVTDGTTSGVKISVESGSITATATKGNWTSIGGLNAGDKFTIGDSTYKVLSDSKTIGLYDANGSITKKYAGVGDDGTVTYDDIIKAANYGNVLTLTDGVLDLTAKPSSSSYTAGVYSLTDGEIDPAKKVASVTYNGTKYDLSEPGTNVGDMTSISLGDVKTLTTTIYKPVTTPASGTFTINGSSFTAAAALTITPNDDGAILTSGKVTLAAGNDVTTASGTIAATTGAITVEVGDNITIGELTNGKVFSVADKSYTMTSIGLSNGDALLEVSNAAITVGELDGEWETIHEAPKGSLTIDTSTPDLAAVVDLSNSSNAVRYGKLTKSGAGYTYEQSGSNKLSSITVNGTTAIIPATSATITANSATFTASGDLTVDATTTIPSVSATTISLTAGTINAPNDVEITVGGRKITATSGSMTVGLVGSDTQIGALDVGDTFTVGNVSYEMTSAGLYIAANNQLVTDGLSSDMKTYTVGDVTKYDTVVTLTNGVLDLTGTPSDGYTALVVSKTNGSADPTKKIARVTYSATDGYTLSEQGTYFSELKSVDLSEVKTFTTELETTVTTPASGTYTINSKPFTAASALTIKTDSNGATLTGGTVSLTSSEVLTPSGTVAATSGTITANVNGSAVTIGNLSNGSAFTFGGKSYTMTAIGLTNDSQLLEVSDSVTATDLSSGDWQTIKQATGGVLTIGTSDSSALIVDTTANPAVKYGTLTKSDSGYTFTQNTALNSITLNGVKATLPATSATITANSATFTATGDLTVDATATIPTISATALTLTAGTINAPNDVEITVDGRKITATSGSMTVGLVGGDTQIGSLDVGDKFTVGTTEYEMTSAGLYIAASGQLVTDGLSSDMKTYTVGDVTVYDTVITLTDGVLDLTGTPSDGYTALVVSKTNGSADPTKKIAKVSYSATDGYTLSEQGTYFSELESVSLSEVKTFTTELETTVTTPASGTYTINTKPFTAASALTIKTDSNGATLTGGTVSLTSSEVLTPSGTVAATSGTITANVNGSAVTIGNLSNGSAFTFGGKSYTMTAIGLTNDSQLLEVSGSVTATDLSSGDWQTIKQATGGVLTIGTSDSSALIVDTTANPAVKYGTLTKTDSGYTFTQNTALTSITLNGVKATLPATSVPITANSATFVADGDLTVDATTTIPSVSATTISLTAGTINAPNDVEITVNGRKITATSGSMTVGLVGSDTQIGALDVGDKFTVGNVSYEMTSAGLYIAASGQLVTDGLSSDMKTYTVGDVTVYDTVITLTNGVLDLTGTPSDGYTALVVSKTNGSADPTKKIARVTYSSTDGYTLSEQGTYFSELTSVDLSEVKTFTTELETTVTTPASGTYTINTKPFTAASALTIKTDSNGATLTSGTVSLTTNNSVTTANGTVTATSGTITANVNGSAVTIGNLSNDSAFTFNKKSYTMTAIGLICDSQLLEKTGSVTNTDLTSDDWQTVKRATGGNLTIGTSDTSALVVDTTANPAVKYGTLTKTDSGYTFTQNTALTSITLNGVKATFPEITGAIKANSATFVADGNLTVDATTSIPTITGATALTVTAGTVNAPSNLEIMVGGMKFTATNGDLTIGLENDKVVVGALNVGDKFTVGNTEYEMTSAGLYIAANNRLVTSGLSDNNTKYTVGTIVYDSVVTLDNGVLDLTDTPAAGYTAYVVSKTSGAADPTKKIAKVSYDGTGYTLSEQGNYFSELTSVSLSEVKTLTTELETIITTPESGTFTINDKTFTANSALTIKTAKDSATLTDGTVSLTNSAVTTPAGTLTATSGTITANVDGSTLTIGNLSTGDAFDFGGASYSMTSIGLSNENRLLQLDDDSVTATELSTGNWLSVEQAPSGNLTIDTSTGSALVVNTAVSPAVIYGTLTKSDSGYTFAQEVELKNITVSGVKATFPATTATVTTSSAVFTASGDFTVDDTTANTNIDGATAITLNSGTINAPEDVEITVGSRKVTATNGDMTVGLVSGKLTIGNLIAGDTFSVNGSDYKVTSAGELYTDGKIVTNFSDSTFVVDEATYVPIIEVNGTNLDLTGVTQDAYVYDSATNPTKRLATLDVSGVKYQLNATSNNVITTIELGDDSVLDNDFPATVSASGSATVNGSQYNANGSLTIISDGSSSTLYEGDISLDPLSEIPELTSDSSTLTVNNGTLTANVVNGKIEKISSLKPNDSFNFNGTTYTQTKLGLVTSGTIREDLAGSSVEVSKLGAGSEFLSPDSDGTLDLTSVDANSIVYDNRDNPSKKLATLTISNGKLILNGSGSNAKDIKTIRLADGANLTVDFTTQIRTTSATVNSQSFNGTGDLLIDAKSKTATLYDGTITFDSSASVKASNGSALAVTGSTSITATANNGVFVRIDDLNAGETFTYGGNTYTQTAFGLVTGSTICEDLTSSTINLDELGNATFKSFTAPVNGTLDLTKATAGSVIYNSYSNPTKKLADLTVDSGKLTLASTDDASDISAVKVADGADLTLNFATKIQASKGSVTVNDQSYTATSDLILDSDGITSTLTDGSVSIPAAQSVVTTSGKRTVANVGDKAITLNADGSTLTIGGLAKDSNFSVDRNEYFITDAALFKKDAQSNSIYTATYSGNVTIAQLDGDNWGNITKLDGTALDVSGDSDSGYLVSSDLGKLYGSLNKTSGGYTLTKGNANVQLSAVNVNGTALTMAPDFATVELSTSKASFDAVKLIDSYANFTLDDSGSSPTFSSNVKSFTLDSGRVAATDEQTVTADNHTVSGDVLITNDDNLVISEISAGETFKLDEKTYKSAEIGLINSDDSALVTAGFENSALNVDAMREDKFIGAVDGTLDLTDATQSAPVLDSATNPTKQVATLTVNNGKLTLNGTDGNTIDTVKVATGTDLTVDFAAQVQAPIGSATVNKQSYLGTTDLTLQSDGTTSKLANGTVSLVSGESVTTGDHSITATAGDGLTVTAGDSISIGGLNTGDNFTVDGTPYKVCAAGLVSGNELYTSDKATTVDALQNDANWTQMLAASYGAFAVNSGTLEDGGEVILVDSTTNPTKTYGTLNKTDGEYLLMKDDTDDDKLGAITVAGTIISIDTELADVPITTVNADESESVFTVKPSTGAITFRVDATGNSPKIDGVDEIDLISGKVQPQDGQIINPAEGGDGEITISYGNGEHKIGDKTVIIDGLNDGDTVDFELDENGNLKKITGLPKGATITIDGTTYTSPFDDATLIYTDEDGWYFDGWTLDEYTVTIDKDGNIKVDTGIRFRNVISSGRTLGDDGSIQLSGERGSSSVKIINESTTALKVNDSDETTLAENLAAQDGVTFSTDGVAADDLQAVAGATINLGEGKSLTAGDDTTVTATDGATVEVGENTLNVDGAARIEAPADIELNLGAGDYSVNGVEFTSGEKTQATATDDGVEFNLADSTGLTYDGMNLTGDENATAAISSDGTVTLTDGAIADNTAGKTLTITGEVQLDEKTVNVDTATAVTSTEKGLNVGETELEVEGDDDGYIINIAASAIIGLENIGSASGVTVGGLDDASIKSDKAGPLTVGDKTFRTSDNSVTWIDDGQIAEVGDVEGTVTGDFSDGLTVNGENIQVQSDKNSEVEVVADEDGVKAIQATEADKYTINGKQYETEGEIKFQMSGGSVTGVETDDATFAIGQNETNFTVNDETLNLSGNTKPVTLDVDGGAVSGVYGVDGAISGLSEATVYDLTRATVNGTPLNVSGSTFDAIVDGGAVSSIIGISAPATINSAPNLSIVTNGDGAFTFGGNTYHVSDTQDSSVTFTTDENSGLTGINDFVGSVSGAVNTLNLNGKEFGTNNGKVTVSSDGENITAIDGVKSGDSIGGDLDKASFTMPEGNLTINGGEFILEDNGGDAQATDGGKIITGIAKDASLTVGADGNYRINGRGARAQAGGVFTVNRDGSYLINPDFLPIIEKTPASEILERSGGDLQLVTSNGTIGAGKDSVAVRNGAEVVIEGEPLIVATSGSVTLENYTGAASIGTFEYLNLGNAIKNNSVMFGDGVMTLGDAVITFEENASSNGATRAQLLNAQGREQKIGFTHTAGGTINASNETANLVLKGNYAEKSDDAQKSGGSNLIGGSGNDMLLIGAGDTADGGAGNDNIYLTNSNLRELGAVIIFGGGSDVVHNFNGGYSAASDEIIISDLNAIEFTASATELVMRSGEATLKFTGMRKGNDLTTLAESSDAASLYDDSYRLKLNDGSTTYNAAIAQAGRNIVVANGDLANVFYGDGSGVNFSEYAGAVAVNLNNGNGNIGGTAAQFQGIDKLTGGAGNSSLTGAADVSNTLTAGTGDGIIWSNSGNDLMVGNTSAAKTGFTTFNFFANDGQDTISGFDFANDWIDITTANEVTSVSVRGSDVIMFINESETDYLTLAQGKGNDFRINNLTAQVDERNLEFDGLANCFVATGTNATMEVGAEVTEATIWLSDGKTSVHGAYYLGDITVLDASKSAGSLILVGNDLNNTILGGAGENSIYGGLGDDLLIGGSGKNTFFFAMVSGNDVIQGAHDGDVIDLGALTTADIASTAIDASGTTIALTDGSLLEVHSNAAIEYKTADGTYTADHTTGQWNKKS